MADQDSTPLADMPDEALWAELERRGAVLRVGSCYPAMCSDDAATELVRDHGYEYGPFQLIERGHRLDEPPHWSIFAQVPVEYRRTDG